MCYLVGALAHGVNEFLDDHVNTFDTGPLQLYDLLLHDSLKRHVWGEKSSPEEGEKKGNSGDSKKKMGSMSLVL